MLSEIKNLLFFRLAVLTLVAPSAAAAPQFRFAMVLGHSEIEQCARNLVRKAQTLTYTCELDIPLKSRKNTRLQSLLSPKTLTSGFGGVRREVLVEVSPDAKVLSLTTSFDATGIDLEVSKFNDDFYAVYNQAAHSVISEAIKKQPVKIEVLETR